MQHTSMSAEYALGKRPFCACCGGGDVRGRRGKYRHTKAKSRASNVRDARAKPRYKDRFACRPA